MKYSIQVTKTPKSRLSEVNFDDIPFGKVFSDHMFMADYEGGQWKNPRILPFGNFEIHPACLGLHYGQSIFEGMKASKGRGGEALLFRPEMHARRINASAERMCMPDFPEDLFLQAVSTLVNLDQGWIPPNEGSALYIRPLMFANGEFFGVKPSDTYKMLIFSGPVGPYYPKPVRLVVEEHYVRAVPGGAGEAKAAGNYGATLLPAQKAVQRGYDQIMWMDGHHFKYVQEVGTMNLFFVMNGVVVTPDLNGAILDGITRDSFITILKDKGIPIEERPVSIDEILDSWKAGTLQEVFGAGTAAVVAHVADITYRDAVIELPPVHERTIGNMLKSTMDKLRSHSISDPFNWIIPIGTLIPESIGSD